MEKIQVAATGHSLNYLPEYLAVENGYFAEEGIELNAIVPSPWDKVITEIEQSTSNYALGGIWVPAMYHGNGKQLVPFAQLAARCPMVIVGRKEEQFQFENLIGKTILVPGGNGASPGMFLEQLLKEHDIDQAQVKMARCLSGAMMKELFVGGLGDYLLIDPISALKLSRETDNVIVTHLSQTGGAIPWSVYYCTPETLGADEEFQVKFSRALDKGMQFVNEHPAEEISALLTKLFPANELGDLITLVNAYREWGMWTSPEIDRPSCERWLQAIADGNLSAQPIPYEELVNHKVAARALNQTA